MGRAKESNMPVTNGSNGSAVNGHHVNGHRVSSSVAADSDDDAANVQAYPANGVAVHVQHAMDESQDNVEAEVPNSTGRKRGRKPKLTGEGRAAFRRINVALPEWIADALEDIAQKRGTSVTEVLRGAVELEAWIEEELESGGDVFRKDEDNRFEPAPLAGRRLRHKRRTTPSPAS